MNKGPVKILNTSNATCKKICIHNIIIITISYQYLSNNTRSWTDRKQMPRQNLPAFVYFYPETSITPFRFSVSEMSARQAATNVGATP